MGDRLRRLLRRFLTLREEPVPANTIQNNRTRWEGHDWSRSGEEWSNPDHPDWKLSLLEHVLWPLIPLGCRVLEIGPGAGRWTEALLERAAQVCAVDLSRRCIELCHQRFQGAANLRLFVNEGSDLSMIDDASVDRIWSFDVFVHIDPVDVERYVSQFPRLLAPGGLAIIHHARRGAWAGGWRSDMTIERMGEICARHGLLVVDQFSSWDGGTQHLWPDLPLDEDPDVVSVIQRPAS